MKTKCRIFKFSLQCLEN